MYSNITLEVIYILVLTENALKKKSSSGFKKLTDFFSLNSVFHIRTYFILRSVFSASYDLNLIKSVLTNEDIDKSTKYIHLKKFRDFLLLFITRQTKKINRDLFNDKLKSVMEILKKYPQNDLATFLFEVLEFIYTNSSEKEHGFVLSLMYRTLEEYIDLFLDSEEIIFNNKMIDEQFGIYFDLLHIKPENICFINKKNNIKIMQNFFPFDIIEEIFIQAGYKKLSNPHKKYFLIEYDTRLVSEEKTELLLHETGHFLNLKIYNFQTSIVNKLYYKDKTVNTSILSYWLNEIIADIIGCMLCKTGKFFAVFSSELKNCEENIKYPPLDLRKSVINETKYDFDKLQNPDMKKVALLILGNIKLIKEMIKII